MKDERIPSRDDCSSAGCCASRRPNLDSAANPELVSECTVGLCCHLEGDGSAAAMSQDRS